MEAEGTTRTGRRTARPRELRCGAARAGSAQWCPARPGEKKIYITRRECNGVRGVWTRKRFRSSKNNADTVLEEIGIEFRDDSRKRWTLWKRRRRRCAAVERVHFPKGLCRELLKTAPPVFTQHARNPERSVQIGGKATVFAPVYGPPFVRDLEGERRYATIEDFRNLVKLAYMAPSMHHSGGTVCEPVGCAGQQAPSRHGLHAT